MSASPTREIRVHTCDKATRRANHQKPVHPLARKYFASVVGQISDLNPRVPPDQRGRAHVTNVAAGCGGRELKARDERLGARTAKSCGPGAPMLAFKLLENFPEVKVARKPGHLGEREISRKPLRRESRFAPVHLWSYPRAFLSARGPWVRSAPGFPCALCSMRREHHARLGHVVPRG